MLSFEIFEKISRKHSIIVHLLVTVRRMKVPLRIAKNQGKIFAILPSYQRMIDTLVLSSSKNPMKNQRFINNRHTMPILNPRKQQEHLILLQLVHRLLNQRFHQNLDIILQHQRLNINQRNQHLHRIHHKPVLVEFRRTKQNIVDSITILAMKENHLVSSTHQVLLDLIKPHPFPIVFINDSRIRIRNSILHQILTFNGYSPSSSLPLTLFSPSLSEK